MNLKNSKGSNYLIQGSILAISSIIVRIIGSVYRIPLNRIIGDTGMDDYSTAYEIYSILLLISSYSLPMAVSKLVSARLVNGEKRNAYRIFKGAMCLASLSGGAVALFTFVFADFLTAKVFKTPYSYFALRFLVPTLFMVAIVGVIRGFFQGNGTMIPTAFSQIIEQIINAVISIVGAYYLFAYGLKVGAVLGDSTHYGAAYGAAGGTIGTGAGVLTALIFMGLIFLMYRPRLIKQVKRDRHKKESYRKIFYVLIITIAPVIMSTTIYNISAIIDLGVFKSIMSFQGMAKDTYSELWGIFSGKYRVLTNVPIGISNAIAASLIPGISGAIALGNHEGVKSKIDSSIRFVMIIVIPCAVGLGVLAMPVMELLFNDTNVLPGRLLQVGSVVIIFTSLSTISNGILQGINKMKVPMHNAIISLVIHLIALMIFLFVFHLNIYAVVYANIVFAVIMCILNGLAIRKYAEYKQEWRKTFILPLLSALAMGLFVFGSYYACIQLTGSNLIGVCVSIVLGMFLYGVFLLLFKTLSPEEILRLPKGHVILTFAQKFHLL